MCAGLQAYHNGPFMRHPITRNLFANWQEARQGGGLPFRDALTLQKIAGDLSHAFIIERPDPASPALFRFMGSHLVDMLGYSLTGRAAKSLIGEAGQSIAWLVDAAISGQTALVAGLRLDHASGDYALGRCNFTARDAAEEPKFEDAYGTTYGEMIVLPMLDAEGGIQLLGAMGFARDLLVPAGAPGHLSITSTRALTQCTPKGSGINAPPAEAGVVKPFGRALRRMGLEASGNLEASHPPEAPRRPDFAQPEAVRADSLSVQAGEAEETLAGNRGPAAHTDQGTGRVSVLFRDPKKGINLAQAERLQPPSSPPGFTLYQLRELVFRSFGAGR